MLYVLFCEDKPDSQALRPAYLAYVTTHAAMVKSAVSTSKIHTPGRGCGNGW